MHMHDILQQNEYAEFNGFYKAVVMDNQDPLMLGRVKLNVINVFDGIETKYLPWAVLASPIFVGAGVDSGCFNVPDVGSYVYCFFEQGDHNQPVVLAEAVDGVHGLPSERTTNYPARRVLKTKSGIVIYIDDDEKEVKVAHPSGSYIMIDADGKILAHGGDVAVDGEIITVDGTSITITGGEISIQGPVDIN